MLLCLSLHRLLLQEPLSLPFLKKYIAFAKQRFAAPELSPEASDAIAGGWVITSHCCTALRFPLVTSAPAPAP